MDHSSKFLRAAPNILRRMFLQVPHYSAAKLFAAVYNEVKQEDPSSKHCYRVTVSRFFAELGLVVDPAWDLREIGAASKYGIVSSLIIKFHSLRRVIFSILLLVLFCSQG